MNTLRGFVELNLPMGKVECLLNLNALRIASQDLKIELNELLTGADEKPLEVLPAIYFAGYKNALYLKNEQPSLQFEHFAAQLGTLDFEELTQDLLKSVGANDETLGNGMGAAAPTP
jgi:hypothetical protein